MQVLINPVNQMVVVSSNSVIETDAERDAFVVCGGVAVFDPRPSSGVAPVEMDFPEESFCDYQMQDGKPVRITPVPKPPVPESVSPRQIRQALTRAGLRPAVEAAVAAGDQDLKDWYEFATEFFRENEHVAELSAALGVTAGQLDDLWILAGSL